MKINKGAKIGAIIQIVALITMIILIISNMIIPSVLMWVFNTGLAISLIGSVIVLCKNKRKM